MNRFTIAKRSGIPILHAQGPNLDAGAIGDFLERLAEISAVGTQVVVDLTAIEFIDTCGLGTLCSLASTPRVVCLAGVCGRLAQGLGRVPANYLPPCYETLADAVAACLPIEVDGDTIHAARRGTKEFELAGTAR